MAFEHVGSLADLPQQEVQPVDRFVQPDQPRLVELRCPVRLTEGKAGNAVSGNREFPGFDRKLLMIGVEPECLGLAAGIMQRDQALS